MESQISLVKERLADDHCRAIVVLGMHRSGTSLVGNLVREWGAYLGPEDQILPANQWNEAGHWEFEPLVRFNRRLLSGIGAATFVPPPASRDAELAEHGRSGPMRAAALKMMAEMAGEGEVWAWKDPQLALLLPFWEQVWTKPVFLIVVRHPAAVARSLTLRDGLPPTAALLLWQRHMHRILQFLKGVPGPSLFVEYEALLRGPATGCDEIAAFLNRQYDKVKHKSRNWIHDMRAAVKTDLDHSSGSDMDASLLTPDQAQLYEHLQEVVKTQNLGELPETVTYIHPCWHDYLTCWQSIEETRRRCTDVRRKLRTPVSSSFIQESQQSHGEIKWR